ncbi:MAG TPA: WXG100 family type VII secretion target [Pseudonocardiaceae bacterium]|jgi:WXG100 family type VII secretion target
MAGEDTIAVNFGAVSNLASQVDSQVKQIEGQLETLKAAIQKLAQEWQGGANEAFQAVQNNWNQSADDLNQVLAKIATAVHAAHDAYQQTESKNTSTWG